MRRPLVDGLSRFLSVLAILAAAGSSVYFYAQNQQLKVALAKVTGDDDGGGEVYQKHADAWDEKLTGALNQFSTDAKASLGEFDVARTARNDIMQNAIRLSEEKVQQVVQSELMDRTVAAKRVAKAPTLRIAEMALKPADEKSVVPIVLVNEGDTRAEIDSVSFQPTPGSQFETSLPDDEGINDQVVIRFSKDHNKPTKAGYHKLYERSYLLPEQYVSANDSSQVWVEIQNDRHVDFQQGLTWGMRGELRLFYNDGRTLVIPSISAVFVPEKAET